MLAPTQMTESTVETLRVLVSTIPEPWLETVRSVPDALENGEQSVDVATAAVRAVLDSMR